MMVPGDWTVALERLFAEREALVDVDPQGVVRERVTYAQLAARVTRAAAALSSLGVGPGARVAILAKNRVEHLELMFACARLGALFLPLNWRLAPPEIAYCLDDATPAVLVYDDANAAVAVALAEKRELQALSVAAFSTLAQAQARAPSPKQAPVGIDDAWIILYTSGTTGFPKGALLPYRQVFFNALNTIVALDLTSADRTITYTPLFHTGGLHVLTTPIFCKGGAIILCEGFDEQVILEVNARERCTVLFGVPTTFERMAAAKNFETVDLSAVRVALCGGAPCPRSLIDRYARRGIAFKQGYGLTEVGPNVLNLNVEDVIKKAGSAGRPNLTITAVVLDDQGRVVHGAGRGELCLGGPCVCLGYWNKPDATRAAFTQEGECEAPAGLWKTGDVVEVDSDGFMSIVDRKKDMFISGGENVYPAEVEKVLCDHPRVRAAAVVGIASAQWGEVGRAYLEVKGDGPLDHDEVIAFLRERLARYKVPKELVVTAELPRNPSGKIQKHLLPASPPSSTSPKSPEVRA